MTNEDLDAALRLADEANANVERQCQPGPEQQMRSFEQRRISTMESDVPALASTVRGLVERVRELERLETVAKAWIIDRNSLSSYAAAMRYDIEHWTAELLKREEPIRKFCEMHFLEESPNA